MSLAVDRYGDRNKPLLVLIHGWGLPSGVWRPWLPTLMTHYRVVTVDLPGMGYSDEQDDLSLPQLANAVYSAVKPSLTRVQEAVWLGWSLGGIVAAKVAEMHPQAVAQLVTLATNPCFVAAADGHPGMARHTFRDFQQTFRQQPEVTLNLFMNLVSQGHPGARQLVRELKLLTANMPVNSQALSQLLQLLDSDHRPLFRSLSVPRLHLFARQDGLVPAAVAKTPEWAQHSRLLEASGHACFIDQGETVLQALLDAVAAEQESFAVTEGSGARDKGINRVFESGEERR